MPPKDFPLDRWLLLAIGVLTGVNAAWMIVGPESWYAHVPAAVPDTGPLNVHFVRDIGCAHLTTSAALVWAAISPRWRFPLTTVAALFFTAHALTHVIDTADGQLDPFHWLLDAPSVYLPAVLLIWLAWRARPGATAVGDPIATGGDHSER